MKLDTSAYEVFADVSGLNGWYVLSLAYAENDELKTRPRFNILGSIRGERF